MARLAQIVVDCRHPAGLARFWTSLGATVHQEFARHTWMRDPEGNDFCVVDG